MSVHKTIVALALASIVLLAAASPADSAFGPIDTAAGPISALACPAPEQLNALAEYRDTILSAASIDEARDLALRETLLARRALKTSATLAPFSENLRLAAARIETYESSVNDAGTPAEVADAFTEFIQLAGVDDDTAVNLGVNGKGCAYSTGETIAIVLGLILGIIPGIILLILLC